MATTSGFYVDLRRDSRVALIAGPYDTLAEAEAIKDRAYAEACIVDPFAVFDAYGTCKADTRRPGVLNARLAASDPAERFNVAGQQARRAYLATRGVAFDCHNPTRAEVRARITDLRSHGRHKGHKGCGEAAEFLEGIING